MKWQSVAGNVFCSEWRSLAALFQAEHCFVYASDWSPDCTSLSIPVPIWLCLEGSFRQQNSQESRVNCRPRNLETSSDIAKFAVDEQPTTAHIHLRYGVA